MTASRIERITVTPVPASYRAELGKDARGDNVGKSALEWLVRARTDSGIEGLTIANAYMAGFRDFLHPEGTVGGLLEALGEVFLNKRTDEFLEASGGEVVAVKPAAARAFRDHGWMSTLALDLLGREMDVSCVDLLGGRRRDRVAAHDATLFFQDFLAPEKGPAQVASEAAESYRAGYRRFQVSVGRGHRWMLPADGLRRDVEVVLAVREAVGEEAEIALEAGRAYDGHLDLLEDLVRETLRCEILWMADLISPSLAGYGALRRIQERTGSDAWLVCGRDDTPPGDGVFQDLVGEGLIDGYQADVAAGGFIAWRDVEAQLQDTRVRFLHTGRGNGNFGTHANVVFAVAAARGVSVEDERCLPNVYRPGARVFDGGLYSLPAGSGLGLEVDPDIYAREYAKNEAAAGAPGGRAS